MRNRGNEDEAYDDAVQAKLDAMSPAAWQAALAAQKAATPPTLYFAGNGRIACRAHMGATAQATGYDLYGVKTHHATAADRAEWLALTGKAMECETCACAKVPA